MSRPRRPQLLARFCAAAALTLFGVSCGDDPQTDYQAENTDDFFAACTDPTIDTVLETRLCQCVIDTVKAEIPFDEFSAMNEAFGAELEEGATPVETPDAIVKIVADCVVAEADL